MSVPIPVQQITSTAPIPVSLGSAAGIGSAVIYNESVYTLLVTSGGASKYIPAWTGDRFDPGPGFDGSLLITPQALSTASDAPSAFVLITAYGKGEVIPGTYPVALARVTNIGNGTINTSTANAVIVSGETPPNDLVKSSPLGYSSPTVDLLDTGAFVLRPLSNNAQVPAFQVVAGDATHPATVQLDNGVIATDGQGNLSVQKLTAATGLTVTAGATSLDGGKITSDGAGNFTVQSLASVVNGITSIGGNISFGAGDHIIYGASQTNQIDLFGNGDTHVKTASGFVFIEAITGDVHIQYGASSQLQFLPGGNLKAFFDGSGNLFGTAGSGIPMTRNGAAVSAPIYTGTGTPSSPPTGSLWFKA